MAVSTVRDICRGALEDLGVLGPGDIFEADDASIALERLSALVDQWAAERYNIYQVTKTTHAITASDGTYTIGSTGDITSVARPMFLEEIRLRDTNVSPVPEYPLDHLTDEAFQAIVTKLMESTYPSAWHYNPTYPNGTITLWPVPTGTGLQLAIYAPQAITRFTTLDDSWAQPPGYERFTRTSLAMDLATPFERQPSAMLLKAYEESKGVVKRSNIRPRDVHVDPAALGHAGGGGRYNIYTDQSR